jgi:hypothetical protein
MTCDWHHAVGDALAVLLWTFAVVLVVSVLMTFREWFR